jgi:hypothetical protein
MRRSGITTIEFLFSIGILIIVTLAVIFNVIHARDAYDRRQEEAKAARAETVEVGVGRWVVTNRQTGATGFEWIRGTNEVCKDTPSLTSSNLVIRLHDSPQGSLDPWPRIEINLLRSTLPPVPSTRP